MEQSGCRLIALLSEQRQICCWTYDLNLKISGRISFFDIFLTVLRFYLHDAATTVSWSEVSCEEGMVGLAVVDISSAWTVNVPFRSSPEVIRLRAEALILHFNRKRRGDRLCCPSSSSARFWTEWKSTCASRVYQTLLSVNTPQRVWWAREGALTPSPTTAWRRSGSALDGSGHQTNRFMTLKTVKDGFLIYDQIYAQAGFMVWKSSQNSNMFVLISMRDFKIKPIIQPVQILFRK